MLVNVPGGLGFCNRVFLPIPSLTSLVTRRTNCSEGAAASYSSCISHSSLNSFTSIDGHSSTQKPARLLVHLHTAHFQRLAYGRHPTQIYAILRASAYAHACFQAFVHFPSSPHQTLRCQQHRRDIVSSLNSKRVSTLRRNAKYETRPA